MPLAPRLLDSAPIWLQFADRTYYQVDIMLLAICRRPQPADPRYLQGDGVADFLRKARELNALGGWRNEYAGDLIHAFAESFKAGLAGMVGLLAGWASAARRRR
jgi:hypothetical protein